VSDTFPHPLLQESVAQESGPQDSEIQDSEIQNSVLKHSVVEANGIRIHVAETGTGPLVLLVHGFPESWYSWRHQMPVLADAGYRVAAIDVRGYGRSSRPAAVEAYRMLCHVGDNIGVVQALGEQRAIIIGHDWGAPIAANSALLRPDIFPAVGMLSVPYAPRGRRRPTDVFAEMGGDEEFYISYFQQPGRAEAEIEPDVRAWITGMYISASSSAKRAPDGGTTVSVRPGGRLCDRFFIPDPLPAWLTEADIDVYAGEFERTGLTGGLNRYRNVDRDWEDLVAWANGPITVPSFFLGGERDGPTMWGAHQIERFGETLPGLVGSHILPGCGHWVQQEEPEAVNRHLLEFLTALS
jgi:pimeloyl-ACP methyl ester carboxylesterase